MRVGWLADSPGYVGGAELTANEFRSAAPPGVEIVDCPPGKIDGSCELFAVHNCLGYSLKDLKIAGRTGRPVYRYWNDVGNWYPPDVREWFDECSWQICCSELQARHMGLHGGKISLIPPPVDLGPFEQAAASMNGNRAGSVSVAQWRLPNKGADAVLEWAAQNGESVDFYGDGRFAPRGSRRVAYQGMPALLARYQRFVFLPTVIEPFGRCVAEAYAAGLELVTNRLVGALEWLEGDLGAIRTAAQDYWRLLLST